MAIASETAVRAYRHKAPKRRASYAPTNKRGGPKVVYFDKKDATPEKIVRALKRNGVVIIRKLASAMVMNRVAADLKPYLDKTPFGEGEYMGVRTKRTSSLVAKSATIGEKLAIHPLILKVVDAMLLDRCQNYRLATTHCVSISKGETLQPLHRDDSIYPLTHPGPESVISTVWAVSEFSEENGATQVVPGSHKWNDRRVPKRSEVYQAVMPKGSVAIYLGSVYHGGAENFTDNYRTGMVLGYSLGWLRSEENQYLACPPAVAKNFSEKLQRLIGYNLHPPYLGWYETNDPHVLLEGKTGKVMQARELYVEGDTGKTQQPVGIKRS